MERGGDIEGIKAWGQKTCGPWQKPCLLDYHAQYADRSLEGFNTSLANFLIGASKYSYFGVGGGWGGDGPGACASWLRRYPEYSKPLGEPTGEATLTQGPYGSCSLLGPKPKARGDTSGCIYTREFASGTKVTSCYHIIPPARKDSELNAPHAQVYVGQYKQPDDPKRPRNKGSCVFWADGSVTSPNVKDCPPKETF